MVFMTTSNGGLNSAVILSKLPLIDIIAAHCAVADHVLVLEQGQIKSQGPTGVMGSAIDEFRRDSNCPIISAKSSSAHSSAPPTASHRIQASNQILEHADLSSKPANFSTVYRRYVQAMGVHNLLALLIFTALYSTFSTLPQYWLKLWTDSGHMISSQRFAVVYALLSITAWLATSCQMW